MLHIMARVRKLNWRLKQEWPQLHVIWNCSNMSINACQFPSFIIKACKLSKISKLRGKQQDGMVTEEHYMCTREFADITIIKCAYKYLGLMLLPNHQVTQFGRDQVWLQWPTLSCILFSTRCCLQHLSWTAMAKRGRYCGFHVCLWMCISSYFFGYFMLVEAKEVCVCVFLGSYCVHGTAASRGLPCCIDTPFHATKCSRKVINKPSY